MNIIITIDERGALTLPQDLIEKYGLKEGGQVVVEETEAGLILRPSAKFTAEIYSDDRVAEFEQQNEKELEDFKLQ